MADGDTQTDLLSQFWLVKGKPATMDAAGFAAVGTYVQMKGTLTIPETGDTAEDISEPTLDDGRVEHINGVVDGGTIDISMKHLEGDAGQAIVLANAGGNDTYCFKIIDNGDGAITYKYGRIKPVRRREKTPTSFKGYIVPLAFNSAEVAG